MTRFLWVTDPWETLDHPRDTTLRLAQEAIRQGHESWWCDPRSIRLEPSGVRVDARRIREIGPRREDASIRLAPAETRSPGDFDSLQYRVDPPVDLAYLHPLQLLALESAETTEAPEIVNPPSAIFASNEKTFARAFGSLMPETLVSARIEDLERFGKRLGRAVAKPLHEAQSKGVELLEWKSPASARAARAKLDALTAGFTRPALLQRYLPGIRQGEQRLWYLDGDLLALARKLPAKGDFRVNIERGSRVVPTALNADERKAAARIGLVLARRGIRLAAVDLIDGFVTDANFTSPGLITEMEEALGLDLAQPIVRALSARK